MLLLVCAAMKAQALTASYTTSAEVPVVSNGFTAAGQTVAFTLNYAPVPGTRLMVVNNTSLSFINGAFSNLTQGQAVTLTYAGVNYDFVADYYGGTGNDLVLHWKQTRLFGWGRDNMGNSVGVFGAPPTDTYRSVPRPMASLGVLEGKTVIRVATGAVHCLALCADGTLAAWGGNGHGQLGDNSNATRYTPVAVNRVSGVSALYGKTVVGIAAGSDHSLALCSDGTVAAWGLDGGEALGNGSGGSSLVPVAVNTTQGTSALYNKTVVSIAAADSHCVALCSDSTVVQWGQSLGGPTAPVLVNADVGVSALHSRTPLAIAANVFGGFVVCTDGAVAAWGSNNTFSRLGDNSTTDRAVPVLVNRDAGMSALYGKTVTSVKAGGHHALALCSDGTVVAWGYNGIANFDNGYSGMVGDGTYTQRSAPVLVSTTAPVRP